MANMTRVGPSTLLAVSLGTVLLIAPLGAQQRTVRIIQTNAAGDNVHLIDPATNRVVDIIQGIPIAHGVTSNPDGSTLYFSNEVDRTLDIVPAATLKVARLEDLEEGENGRVYWSEAASRRNFEVVSRLVVPGSPEHSRLLRKPLAVSAGGVAFHVGGKFWQSQSDPEWQIIADWIRAASVRGTPSETAARGLDFEFFRSCVQKLFLSKRPGHVECVHCHNVEPRNFAPPIPAGRDFWNLEESQQNFVVVRQFVEPGFPLMSRFLLHPLAPKAGGDHMHAGGRRWQSQDDPEWRMLAAWVRGERPACVIG